VASYCAKEILKGIYLSGRVVAIGSGEMADFWRDPWCGIRSLKDKFPELFEICNDDQVCSVASKAQRNWNLTFRRWLDEGLQNKLRELLDLVRTVPIAVGRDGPRWTWGKNVLC
jgi:hypothetical protein